ncbi:MAG: inositol monophosphatase family protein [Chloroflexota bacterium]|nr:inositol monophosphatase family protein [Chloroflexota bacterium]
MLDFIEKTIKQAGDMLMEHFGTERQLLKLRATVKDSVTKYDKMVDELIIGEIKKKYSNHSMVTEESGFLKGDPDWLWIVDSLDGTSGYASSNPLFSVCIALMNKGNLTHGAVYAPAINELYLAERGNGAYLNHARIHTSKIAKLEQGYVFSCEGGEKDRIKTLDLINKVYPEVMDLRKLGSAGLETAWVAAGKGEAYFTTQIDPWDVAAGVLLVEEAAGKVTDFNGNRWQPVRGNFLFSNGNTHSAMLELLQEK